MDYGLLALQESSGAGGHVRRGLTFQHRCVYLASAPGHQPRKSLFCSLFYLPSFSPSFLLSFLQRFQPQSVYWARVLEDSCTLVGWRQHAFRFLPFYPTHVCSAASHWNPSTPHAHRPLTEPLPCHPSTSYFSTEHTLPGSSATCGALGKTNGLL